MILILVMIVLPIVLAKLGGGNPMEMFFGRRVKGTAFDPGEDKKAKEAPKVRNGSKQDLLQFASLLTTFSRKHKFSLMLPGRLTFEEESTILTAILVTKSMVIGFNCFGYGGTVTAGNGEEDWTQMRGEEKVIIDSPSKKNAKQKEILLKILAAEGRTDIPVEIFGVFTTPNVTLIRGGKANCYVPERIMEIIGKEKYLADKGYVPGDVQKLLVKYKSKD